MRLAARTWTQLGGRSSVAFQGQFWTITKAPNTGLVLADTRSTGRFTAAFCSVLCDAVGFDTNILYERPYVGDKGTKLKVKYWNKVYRRRWEEKRVLRKGCGGGTDPSFAVQGEVQRQIVTLTAIKLTVSWKVGKFLTSSNDWLNTAVECVVYLLLEREPQVQSQPKPRLSELRAFVLSLNPPRKFQ